MCAGMLVHISRHLGKTSNNNKRCQLFIHCMFCNSGCINLVYDNVRYTVYIWGFPCLDYSSDVLISWSHKLGLYHWCCHICFHASDFWFVIIIILYLLTSCFTTCVLFHQSPTLILLYHEYSLLDIACYLSTCFCMLVLTTRFSMHNDDSDLSIHVCLSLQPFGIHITTHWGNLTPLDPHFLVSELWTCWFSRLLIRAAQQ